MPVATGIEIVKWALPGIKLKDMYVQNDLVLLACGFEVVRPFSEPFFFCFPGLFISVFFLREPRQWSPG